MLPPHWQLLQAACRRLALPLHLVGAAAKLHGCQQSSSVALAQPQ